ncbi:M48 family metalloprotease [Haloferax sp. MBLA0076]|uniref:M48 family metalloprotease n=1 Tax=Haloferax litoreum TaxID=2666140 RepID=A0A6A8GFF8_9EURY|nr:MULTISPECIES: M48 family metalloprotease [Haloferax]KAB1193103.1 M48 family metalloprotease [Haloferax sp. CBA1148]MRX21596.1 M48 family metalloprotease [Haloferax litoreum]
MKHTGLKLRMAVSGTVLFAFYMLLATAVWEVLGSVVTVVVLTVLFVGVQYKLGKWLALRSIDAEELPEDEFADVHQTVESLSAEMGITKPKLMYAPMGAPNAFAVGRQGSGVVVLGTELMQILDDDELKGVIAHELTHLKNRDVVPMVLGQSIAMLFGWGVYFVVNEAIGGIVGWILGWIASIIAQLLVTVFVLVISRVREYAADEDAAQYTGNPEALASALAKIGHVNEQVERTAINDSVSALCIFGQRDGILARLFASHPPMEKRIARLQQLSG